MQCWGLRSRRSDSRALFVGRPLNSGNYLLSVGLSCPKMGLALHGSQTWNILSSYDSVIPLHERGIRFVLCGILEERFGFNLRKTCWSLRTFKIKEDSLGGGEVPVFGGTWAQVWNEVEREGTCKHLPAMMGGVKFLRRLARWWWEEPEPTFTECHYVPDLCLALNMYR